MHQDPHDQDTQDAATRLDRATVLVRDLPHDGPVDQLREVLAKLETLRTVVATTSARVTKSLMQSGVVRASGARGTADFLTSELGVSKSEAAGRAVLADVLDGLPGVERALLDGDLGEAQATELARAVRRGRLGDSKTVEAALLSAAVSSSPEQLRDEVRRREDAADADALASDEGRAHRQRTAYWRHDPVTGTVRVGATLDPVQGAVVISALEAMVCPDPSTTPPELRRTSDQLRADALHEVCAASLAAGAAGVAGGVRPHVVLTVAGVVDDEHPRGWRLSGHADAVGPISGTAIERLSCDSAVRRAVIDANGAVLDIGQAERSWPVAIRAAIVLRDRHCRFPGCELAPWRCIVHHVTFWADGGPTSTDNGVLLCWHHHHVVHDRGWRLTYDPVTDTVRVDRPGQTATTLADEHHVVVRGVDDRATERVHERQPH